MTYRLRGTFWLLATASSATIFLGGRRSALTAASAALLSPSSFRAPAATAAGVRRRSSPPSSSVAIHFGTLGGVGPSSAPSRRNDRSGRLGGKTFAASRHGVVASRDEEADDGSGEKEAAESLLSLPSERRRFETTTTTTSCGDSGRRKAIFRFSSSSLLLPFVVSRSSPANARGLVKFPCTEGSLLNTYHLLRAGRSLLEEENVLSTNPLFLTNREAALSEIGIRQVEEACDRLKSEDVSPTVVRYSLAASAVDSANIVGRELKIGRDRLVPEFNYMDPRAVGKWNGLPLSSTEAAIWSMDVREAGPYGTGARPPPNEDGTPNETLSDQVTRLTQLLSVLETQYSGDTILLIFPDGTGPALLTALMAGIPLNRVHELNFESGEVRCDVTAASGLRRLEAGVGSASYEEILVRGSRELESLRRKGDDVVDVKDRKYEEERKAAETKAAVETKAREDADRAEREAIAVRQTAEREARRERALQLESERQKKREELAVARQRSSSSPGSNGEDGKEEDGNFGDFLPAVGTAGVAATAALTLRTDDDGGAAAGNRSMSREAPTIASDERSGNATSIAVRNSTSTEIGNATENEASDGEIVSTLAEERPDGSDGESDVRASEEALGGTAQRKDPPSLAVDGSAGADERASSAAFENVVENYGAEGNAPAVLERNAKEVMDDYLNADDGGDEWLGMISDLMREEEGD